jgi:pilus assembly protein CpaB
VSSRTGLIRALALIAGLSALACGSRLHPPATTPGAPETVSIVVARVDMPRFITITNDMVTTRPYPKDQVPSGAMQYVEEALDRVVYVPLLKDEPVINSKLAAKGLGRSMVAIIPAGMQAYTIPTPTVSAGVAGFIRPGNTVDVLLIVISNDGGRITRLLQCVEILAVDERVDAPAENKGNDKELRSVTLKVTPRQAAMLALGQSKGILVIDLPSLAASTKPCALWDACI